MEVFHLLLASPSVKITEVSLLYMHARFLTLDSHFSLSLFLLPYFQSCNFYYLLSFNIKNEEQGVESENREQRMKIERERNKKT